jgi:cob(I)alamin adenosyltransferase
MRDHPVTDDRDSSEVPTDDPRPDGLRRAPSVVVVNTGHGKGKSSAAFGVMVRGLARDWKVAVVQFVKSGKWHVGEEKIGRQLGVDWFAVGDGFTWDSADLEHDKALAQAGWKQAADLLAAGEHRLVIFDELTYLCNWGWLDTAEVVAAVRARPDHVNVVITGRDAPEALIEVADTATDMREIKHAYQRGIRALRGVDY